MAPSDPPIDSLPVWSRFNGVVFNSTIITQTEGKGYGLVAQRDIESRGDDGKTVVLSVPCGLLLNSESVEQYAKEDQQFKELFAVAGHQSSRQDVILFLLAQIMLAWANDEASGVSNPWTQYIKYLPRAVPLPTLWSEEERSLLIGTSLEAAVESKLMALENEFGELLEKASSLPSWSELLCEKQIVTVGDYMRLDAWHRSRCMELPVVGSTMVPCIDMVNHSATPNALYIRNGEDGVDLCLLPGAKVAEGEEISISYGGKKSHAEMLFSYGFVDPDSSGEDKIILPLESPEDDPLAMAKIHIYGEKPTIRITRSADGVQWDCPFVHLVVLNEEDGLGIRLLQLNDGGRQIRLFWQEEDVTDSVRSLDKITRQHAYHLVFQLRAVVVVQERLQEQLERISARGGAGGELPPAARSSCASAAALLRSSETRLLRDAVDALESQKTQLLADESVVGYLGQMEVAQSGLADSTSANEEPDFS